MKNTAEETTTTAAAQSPAVADSTTTAAIIADSTARSPVTQAIADLNPSDSAQVRLNVAFCAVLRLIKALLAAAVTAGVELARVQSEMGDSFSVFIETQTAWSLPAAHAMIRFAREARLEMDRLTPTDDVALEEMLERIALLGRIYQEQQVSPVT